MADTKVDALYARYSSHKQDDGTSIEMQVEACERAAGCGLARYIDEARTGRAIGGRLELQRLIRDAAEGRIDRLFVHKYDRFGRAAEAHVVCADLDECGVRVISVCEGTDKLSRGINLVVAEGYSRDLAVRTRAGQVIRHRAGCWVGGPAPYGYRLERTGGRKDGRTKIMVEPAEAGHVRWMYERYAAGAGLRQLAAELQERGSRPRRTARWEYGCVREVLRNPIVIGEVHFGRRKFVLNKATGRRIPRRVGGAEVRRDESLAIVDAGLFAAVQARFAVRGAGGAGAMGRRPVRAFTRLVYCACGRVCTTARSRNARGDYVYYECASRRKAEPCGSRARVREDVLRERVRAAMREVVADVDGVLEEAGAMALAEQRAAVRALKRDEAELAGAEAEARRLGAALAKAMVDGEMEPGARKLLARLAAEAEAKVEAGRAALAERARRAVVDAAELVEECRKAIERAKAMWDEAMDGEELNRFVGEVVGRFELGTDGEVRVGTVKNETGGLVGRQESSGNSGGSIYPLDVVRAVFAGAFASAA